ncbi:GNAT family N-acetyltransferase [Fonticella tunisiensis]|uniref:RimJ/RimL family protein N-acetyltransferase n=1 Tax=Fonticella tunisiensis TaxID=1096341 RepID=A0A4R7K9X6_9CLOT|nr:GNAT family protein [Fonticella tunisiensis]TDT51048.1 RimJ/RimL family protein N-acetyltransferase [Fonticella tunisiensis]
MRKLLIGDKIKLTSIRDDDLEIIEEWFNDVEFMRYYDMLPAIPKTSKDVKEMIDGFSNTDERYVFAIRDKESSKIIGITGFDEIIWSSGVATIFIGIWDENYRGIGIGKEAMSLILDFGFNELNFHRIQLNVISYNERAIRLYEGQGFVKEGTCREFIYRDGKRYDLHFYGLLRSEWSCRRFGN